MAGNWYVRMIFKINSEAFHLEYEREYLIWAMSHLLDETLLAKEIYRLNMLFELMMGGCIMVKRVIQQRSSSSIKKPSTNKKNELQAEVEPLPSNISHLRCLKVLIVYFIMTIRTANILNEGSTLRNKL